MQSYAGPRLPSERERVRSVANLLDYRKQSALCFTYEELFSRTGNNRELPLESEYYRRFSEHAVAVGDIPYLSSTSLTFPSSAVIERELSLFKDLVQAIKTAPGIPCRDEGGQKEYLR